MDVRNIEYKPLLISIFVLQALAALVVIYDVLSKTYRYGWLGLLISGIGWVPTIIMMLKARRGDTHE